MYLGLGGQSFSMQFALLVNDGGTCIIAAGLYPKNECSDVTPILRCSA